MKTLALVFLSLVAVAPAQNWIWRIVPGGPSPRSGHAMAFDSVRGVTVLFGGVGATTAQVFTDTWEWDGTAWTQRFPALSPARTATSSMVFDSSRGVCVLVGGNGTWEWDGAVWALRSPQIVNPAYRGLVAYDPVRARTVVLQQLAAVSQGSVFIDHYWSPPAVVMEWDGSSWQAISTVNGPFYSVMSMAWDPSVQRVSAYTTDQGLASPTAGARLWRWDGAAWTSNAPVPMPYNGGGVMVTLPTSLVLYGGGYWGYALEGLYEPFNYTTQVTPANPGGRGGHGMVYDSHRQRLVLFGGYYCPWSSYEVLRGDTWEYVPSSLVADSAQYGRGCGTPEPTLAAAPGSRPLLGSTFIADVGNALAGATGMSWGSSGQRRGSELPFDMAPWGMPGCPLQTSFEGITGCSAVGGAPQFALPVPSTITLLAAQLYLQAFTFRPGANPRQFVVSNGLQLTVGDQ